MKPERRIQFLERELQTAYSHIEKIEHENEVLLIDNSELANQVIALQDQVNTVETVRIEYESCIAEMANLKDSYRAAITDLQCMKNEYRKQFKQLIGQMK